MSWAESFQAALQHWSEQRIDRSDREFQACLDQLADPTQGLWRLLVCNQWALLDHEQGRWEDCKEHWELARRGWSDGGFRAGDASLEASLIWLEQLLSAQGFADRAGRILQQHRQNQAPLLDPWQEPAQLTALGATAELGQTPSLTPPQALARALTVAALGKLVLALPLLDQARQQLPHSLVYNCESLCCFLAGDYSAASQARDESLRLWQSSTGPTPDSHRAYTQALEEGGQAPLAEIYRERYRQRQCPLLDPWRDLGSSLPQMAKAVAPAEATTLEAIVESFVKQRYAEVSRQISVLESRLDVTQRGGYPGLALRQLLALSSHASGDYGAAQELYSELKLRWPQAQGGRAGWDLLVRTLDGHGCTALAEVLRQGPMDPFQQHDSGPTVQSVEEQPVQDWGELLCGAWVQAGQGRWDAALRQAGESERALADSERSQRAYNLLSQALFSQAAGRYAEADALYEDTLRQWPSTVHSAFCDILESSGWSELSLRQRGQQTPLEVDCLSATQLEVLAPAPLAVSAAPQEPLALPDLPSSPQLPTGAARRPPLAGLAAVVGLVFVIGLVWWWMG